MAVQAGGAGFRRATVWVCLSLAVLVLAACGAPAYTYVTNSADKTYLKIPNSWHPIDQDALDNAVGLDPSADQAESGLWLEGYDADAAPSPMHLFGQHTAVPAALVSVQAIPESARGQFSLDSLRDMFFPVSASARQQMASDPSSPLTDFALLADDVLTPGHGLRGVRNVYRYRMGDGPLQIFDQTGYINDDASKLYTLFVRCSTECYQERQQEITAVVSSFTIRETP